MSLRTITILLLFTTFFQSGCRAQPENKKTAEYAVEVVNYVLLQKEIQKKDNKLYVVNFWATWCQPCVAELPDFMEVNAEIKSGENFEMVLVSLDEAEALSTKVIPFIEKHKLDVRHFLLDDIRGMNDWIPAVNKDWSGAIPATVFYKNGEALHFVEGKLSKSDLKKIISKHL